MVMIEGIDDSKPWIGLGSPCNSDCHNLFCGGYDGYQRHWRVLFWDFYPLNKKMEVVVLGGPRISLVSGQLHTTQMKLPISMNHKIATSL
jgi:hypothetical protein